MSGSVPSPDEHRTSIERAISLMSDGSGLDKVVLAGSLRVSSTSVPDPAVVLNNLSDSDS